MALILDTGPLLALLDRNDRDHARCQRLVAGIRQDLVLPSPILVEVNYWLRKRNVLHVWKAVTEDIEAGAYRLHHPDEEDIVRAAELELQYASLDLGFVDAAVIVACERLGETRLATLNRHDFSVIRPRHCKALQLLPE